MTGRYKVYPECKDSGVEWLGKVPEDWSIHSLKRTVDRVTNGVWGSEPDGENDLIVFRVADFNRNQLNISENKLTFRSIEPKDRASRLLRKGDLLIEKSGGGDKTLVGCVVLFDKDYTAVTSNFVAKMTPRQGFDSSFLRYAFSKLYAGKVNFPSIKQTTGIQNLDSNAYLLENFVFPTYDEQQKIANFLDHETAKIDTLIAKQEKLIALLKEKRQAVISHAVTKGLNPAAPMKNSGVKWLGEVPEHWEVIPNKRLFELTPKKSQIESKKNKLCNFVPMDKLKQDSLVLDEERLISSVFDGYTYFGNEDILMAKVTPCFENKNMVVARNLKNGIGFGSSEIYVLRCNKEVNNDFIYYRLQENSFMNIATSAMTGAGGLKRVPADVITNFLVAIPPLDEQLNIVKTLKEKILTFDELSKKANGAIELMKERKITLISAAVTGKIDVRDWQLQGVQG